jgi:hypothetical protein
MTQEIDDLSPEQRYELARTREAEQTKRHANRWSAIKAVGVAFVGTVIVGLTTTIVNYSIQRSNLALEEERTSRILQLEERKFAAADRDARRRQEQEYLQSFVSDALNEDIQRRIDFAQYVASVTLSEDMRMLWQSYHKALEDELTDTRADLKLKVAELEQQRLLALEGDVANEQTIAQLQGEIRVLGNRLGKEPGWTTNRSVTCRSVPVTVLFPSTFVASASDDSEKRRCQVNVEYAQIQMMSYSSVRCSNFDAEVHFPDIAIANTNETKEACVVRIVDPWLWAPGGPSAEGSGTR